MTRLEKVEEKREALTAWVEDMRRRAAIAGINIDPLTLAEWQEYLHK